MFEKTVPALLIDGSPDPPAILIEPSKRSNFISQGRAGDTARNFEFVRRIDLKVEFEENPRTCFVYRLKGGRFTDAEFEELAAAEVDKHLHPEKYSRLSLKPSQMEAQLAEYMRRYGPLKDEA